jgi:hypothetical protein
VSSGERVFLLFLALSHFLRHLPVAPSRAFNSERKEAAAAAAAAASASLSSSFFFFAHEEYTLSFSSLLSHPKKKINKKQKQLVLV